LWSVPEKAIQWDKLDLSQVTIIACSSFIDPADPFGPMGSPYAIVIGEKVIDLTSEERLAIAKRTNTPETIFINGCQKLNDGSSKTHYALNLTVLTIAGKEMGACAGGFIGAIQTLLEVCQLQSGSEVTIHTTIDTTTHASVSADGSIALEFEAQPAKEIAISSQRLADIYGVPFTGAKNLGVLSVGSPKLTIELPRDAFVNMQKNLDNISYDKLLILQQEVGINGIHLFSRNAQTLLPEKCVQTNAYSGMDNLMDRATGVSNAPQVSADTNVKPGQTVQITQYVASGPSAILNVSKGAARKVTVGGSAVLINYETI
jgi:predicted PhzF superfamily epimerase YddE/YHI9